MALDLKNRERDALIRMLNFGASGSQDQEMTWKVVIYDRLCRDIISPLLNIGELRKQGVTLHMLLHQDREPLSDVPAVYFVQPTQENIQRISEDCMKGLYPQVYLNFVSQLPRPLMEDLAQRLVDADASNVVTKLFDLHLDFIALEPTLFTLNRTRTYPAIKEVGASDTQIDGELDAISEGLFSVFATAGVVPVIRCPADGPAAMVASKLDRKLRDRAKLFQQQQQQGIGAPQSLGRPVLIVVDRDLDQAVMLHHSWTYQALMHDCLNVGLNIVTVPTEGDAQQKNKRFELDATADSLWATHAGTPFPQVAEEIDTRVKDYNTKFAEVSALTSDGQGAKLTSYVSSLPELTERKRQMDAHTLIATALLNHVKRRELDTYFALEEALMNREPYDRAQLLSVLQSGERGTVDDRLRLFLIYYLCSDNVDTSELAQYEAALASSGADLSCFKYVKRMKAFTGKRVGTSTGSGSTVSRYVDRTFEGLTGLASKFKNLLPSNKALPLTRIVDAVMDNKASADTEGFITLDPLSASAGPVVSKQPYRDAVVFVVGGGNYVEYQNLVEYTKKQANNNPKTVVYGTTEILNGEAHLRHLQHIGSKM